MRVVVEVDVVGHEEVQIAAALDIQKARPGADLAGAGHAGLLGHRGKRAVAVVAVQHMGAKVGNEQVGPAIIVVVAHGNPQAVAGVAHPGLLGHILEAEVAQVAVQGIAGWRAFPLRAAQRGAIDEIDIHQAVAVVVERGQAGADRFDDVPFAARAIGMAPADAGAGGQIAKLDRAAAGVPQAGSQHQGQDRQRTGRYCDCRGAGRRPHGDVASRGGSSRSWTNTPLRACRYSALPGSSRAACSSAVRAPWRSPLRWQAVPNR